MKRTFVDVSEGTVQLEHALSELRSLECAAHVELSRAAQRGFTLQGRPPVTWVRGTYSTKCALQIPNYLYSLNAGGMREGNVSTGVCLLMGGTQVSGPRFLPGLP